jgi:hypothetical protein
MNAVALVGPSTVCREPANKGRPNRRDRGAKDAVDDRQTGDRRIGDRLRNGQQRDVGRRPGVRRNFSRLYFRSAGNERCQADMLSGEVILHLAAGPDDFAKDLHQPGGFT